MMRLTGLTDVLRGSDAYHTLLSQLRQQSTNPISAGLIRAARPLLLGALAEDWGAPIIFITGRVKYAHTVAEQLPVWLKDDLPIARFAEPTPQFYERIAWGETVIHSRIQTLMMLLDDSQPRSVVVSSARAFMQRTIAPTQFRQNCLMLRKRDRYALDKLLKLWTDMGYSYAPMVLSMGTYSRRGGVVDIFPVGADKPVRIEFFDDEIDTMRQFDPATQRSDMAIDALFIPPARESMPQYAPAIASRLREWFNTLPSATEDMTTASGDFSVLEAGGVSAYLEHYLPFITQSPVSLLDYAPLDALIVVDDMGDIQAMADDLITHAEKAKLEGVENYQLSPDHPRPYLSWDDITEALNGRKVLVLGQQGESFSNVFAPSDLYAGQLRPMLTALRKKTGQGESMVVITEQAGRLRQLWQEQTSGATNPLEKDLIIPPVEGITFIENQLSEGWVMKTHNRTYTLLTDSEIFGWHRPEPRRRKTEKTSRPPESDYADWREGEYVVHVDYGVGRFLGLKRRTLENTEREYLMIQYGGSDTLYVPIHQADRLSRYIGADDIPPALHKLGKPEWERAMNRAQKSVLEEAEELLSLYATREATDGHAFAPDTHWQAEMEASFPFIETEDQLKAVKDVKADMEAQRPMDRLICGDVGYGKTEVALRAAFKAVMDGKQVAVLVPTTVLAQQHGDTFMRRLSAFPVKIESLSRFRTKQEENRMLPLIASGEIDIVVGTHRLLSADVTFKSLGLVIIDEEQRFGVKHKEHLKKLRTQVDVLTLTATPIPRTLYMSLAGVRDMSMIQTPPEERLPIITHVGRFDTKMVRQAILRELERGGQVFVVHNRVHSIEMLRDQFNEIVPEARIIIGHGQMPERQLEQVMAAFSRYEYDILIATTIIESGIDMPNANTLIVDRADRLGLAQLYQLRGRVGRGAQQGFAYFFHPKNMTEDAIARLGTLAENTQLGAGYQIAMRDLEIRGAGDILSTKQTGHVSAIGLHLYTQLLNQAVRDLKGLPKEKRAPINTAGIILDLPIAAYLPADWIPEIALRLQIYRRIGALGELHEVFAMLEELRDRFGALPHAVEGLLFQIEIKIMAQTAGATAILAREDAIHVKLPYLGEINRERMAHRLGGGITVSRVAVMMPLRDNQETWRDELRDLLTRLADSGRGTGI
jgi:transcription-repair coupling factor (superfamily II helicase)